jgi:hypothetical protein
MNTDKSQKSLTRISLINANSKWDFIRDKFVKISAIRVKNFYPCSSVFIRG